MSRTCPDCQSTYDDDILHCPEDGHNLGSLPPVDELIGRSIGSYRVEKMLGKGGMGAVYMGVHPVIGSRVAIKFLHPQYAHDDKIVDRFYNEARAVNVIGHDNILKILDLNITDDHRHYFVMEYLHGRALQSLIKQGKPVSLEVAGPILLQCCNALEAAHRKGIVHRDLKPDNVYLISLNGKKNFVKVVDFGIARVTDDAGASTGKTQTGMVMGTPAYMSPEQGSGATSKIDARSDVYSLGIMMFQLATGRLPFPGSNFGEVLVGHLQQQPPAPRSLNPEIPEAYEQIILKCLEKAQENRFQSMAELHEAILSCLEGLGLSHELPHADDVTDPELAPVELSPSSPGMRTPSRPGRGTSPGSGRAQSRPGAGRSNAQLRSSSPNARASNPSLAQRRSLPPQEGMTQLDHHGKSRLPLFLGIGAGALVALAAIGAFVFKQQSNDRAAERKLELAKATRQAAPIPAAQAKDNGPVFLSVVCDPLEAQVVATWKDGGEKRGPAPLSIEVPKDTKVHFAFSKDGYVPYEMDVIADNAQTVEAKLKPEPKTAGVVAEPESSPRPSKKPGKKARHEQKHEEKPASNDGLIDIDDALK